MEKDATGEIKKVRLAVGPHYFVELHRKDQDGVEFAIGATRHGFRADASEVNGELEQIINEMRERHAGRLVV